MSDHGQEPTPEKSTGKEPLSKSEESTDTDVNVWHIPAVRQQLRELQELVDKDELRIGCYQESLITPAQRNHLATLPTNREHNGKLVQFLEAGKVFSFYGFIEVLKRLPKEQQIYHKGLSQASLAYVDRIQHAEQVRCLVQVKDGENGAPAQLEIDEVAVEALEVRYLFVSQFGKKVDNATGDVLDSHNPGHASTDCGSSDQSEEEKKLLDKWLKDDSSVAAEKDSRIMQERLSRRIVLLAGDFDIIVKDLSSRGVATQKSLAQLTANAEESGIYCLTPAAKAKPIYMILKLKRQTAPFHTRILRLALEMSRHLVIYHSEAKLMAGKYFNPSQAQQKPGVSRSVSTSARASTVHGGNSRPNFSLDLDDQSVDVLQILHSVLVTCPLTSRLDLNHRSVHLYCVLDVPHEAAQSFLELQCGNYCKKLFGINPLETKSGKSASQDAVLGHFPRSPILEKPAIRFPSTFNVTKAHRIGTQKVKSNDPDPWVDQMWLYSMCGLIPRRLLTCIMTGAGGGRCELVTEDSHARKNQESSNTDDVQHNEQQLQTKYDEISFGLLERVLSSWKGAVQITTVLADKDDKWTQEFLHRQAGLPFFSSTDDPKDLPSVMVAWRFSQALNLLRLFLVFADSVPAVAPRMMSRLVYASTAVSNICILPESSAKDGTQSMLRMYLECLNSVVGEDLQPYKDAKDSHEEEILSGTLLVSGEHDDDTAKELTDRYLCHVVYLDQQRLESATEELLSSHSQQHMYASGPKCLDILKLVVISINEENFNALSLQDLYLREYKSEIRKLNKVARRGIPVPGSRDKPDASEHDIAFTVEIGLKFAVSVSGYEDKSDEEFMEIERTIMKSKRAVPASGDTVRTDLRPKQLDHHRILVGLQCKLSPSMKELQKTVQAEHARAMDKRIEGVRKWRKANINGTQLRTVFGTTLVAECDRYVKGMEDSRQLCLEQCNYKCHYQCLLPAGHPVDIPPSSTSTDSEDSARPATDYAPRKHDCLLCDTREKDKGEHQCNYGYCELCTMDGNKRKCCLKPGHQLDRSKHENVHLCMTRPELESKGKHRCEQKCPMVGARGKCGKICKKLKEVPRVRLETPHGPCYCGFGKDEHLCDKQCDLCGEDCKRQYKHPTSDAHNCGIKHICSKSLGRENLCEEEGVCSVDRNLPEPKSKLVRPELKNSNGWKRPCKRIIPAWEPTHVGLPHSCLESGCKSIHTCKATCRWCNHFCEKPFGHHKAGSPCAPSNHGQVIHPTDKIKPCKSDTVRVDELALRKWTPSPDSGVVPKSPTTCSTLCSQAGPRHIHLVPTARGCYTEVKHSDFWKQDMAFTDPTKANSDFVKSFDGCPERCEEKGHGSEESDDLYCVEDAVHTLKTGVIQKEVGGVLEYISSAIGEDSRGRPRVPGHRFRCGVPHLCGAVCSYYHLKGFTDTVKNFIWTQEVPCKWVISHKRRCKCARPSVHACGQKCSATKCTTQCQVPVPDRDDGNNDDDGGEKCGSSDHTCTCKSDQAKCLDACELIECSSSKKPMDKAQHDKICFYGCKPCGKTCKSPKHFHRLDGAGEHHSCGRHKCKEPCVIGACDGSTARRTCNKPLDGWFRHKDGSSNHTCAKAINEHGCPATCVFQPCHKQCALKRHPETSSHKCKTHQHVSSANPNVMASKAETTGDQQTAETLGWKLSTGVGGASTGPSQSRGTSAFPPATNPQMSSTGFGDSFTQPMVPSAASAQPASGGLFSSQPSGAHFPPVQQFAAAQFVPPSTAASTAMSTAPAAGDTSDELLPQVLSGFTPAASNTAQVPGSTGPSEPTLSPEEAEKARLERVANMKTKIQPIPDVDKRQAMLEEKRLQREKDFLKTQEDDKKKQEEGGFAVPGTRRGSSLASKWEQQVGQSSQASPPGAAPGVGSDNAGLTPKTPQPPSKEEQLATGKNSPTPVQLSPGAAPGVGSDNAGLTPKTPQPPSKEEQPATGKNSPTPVQLSPATQGHATSGKRTAQ